MTTINENKWYALIVLCCIEPLIIIVGFYLIVINPVDNWFEKELVPILNCDQVHKLIQLNSDPGVNLSYLKIQHKECFND